MTSGGTSIPDLQDFLRHFRTLSESAHQIVPAGDGPPFAEALSTHLGQPAAELAVITEEVANHRFADWDIALALLAERDPDAGELGIGGGEMRYHQTLTDFLSGMHGQLPVARVDYVSVPTGPDTHRRTIGFGMRLFRFRDTPVGRGRLRVPFALEAGLSEPLRWLTKQSD